MLLCLDTRYNISFY